MTSQRKSTKLMQESTRAIATELIREPVKQAVREALHEEAATVSSAGAEMDETARSQPMEEEQKRGRSGRSRGRIIGALAAIVGIAYLARRRMSSTTGSAWTESSPGSVAEEDAEGGYVSEGEMQTAEANDETE